MWQIAFRNHYNAPNLNCSELSEPWWVTWTKHVYLKIPLYKTKAESFAVDLRLGINDTLKLKNLHIDSFAVMCSNIWQIFCLLFLDISFHPQSHQGNILQVADQVKWLGNWWLGINLHLTAEIPYDPVPCKHSEQIEFPYLNNLSPFTVWDYYICIFLSYCIFSL